MSTFIILLMPFVAVFVFSTVILLLSIICAFLQILITFIGVKYTKGCKWIVEGIIIGSGSVFLTCYVIKIIMIPYKISEIWIFILALILPLIGEIEYFKYLAKKSNKVKIIGRLNFVARTLSERGLITLEYMDNIERQITDKNEEEKFEFQKDFLVNPEAQKSAGDKARETVNSILFLTFLWGVLGYFFGVLLVHFVLFN